MWWWDAGLDDSRLVRNRLPCSISEGDGYEALRGVARYDSSAQLGCSFDALWL